MKTSKVIYDPILYAPYVFGAGPNIFPEHFFTLESAIANRESPGAAHTMCLKCGKKALVLYSVDSLAEAEVAHLLEDRCNGEMVFE